jgi:hypothetical protein
MSYTKLSGRTASDLSVAINEWDVNTAYRNFFTRKIQTLVFTSPYMCDGYAECTKNKIKLLIEFKNDVDLSDRRQMCEVLIQAIYYIKKFELDGKKLPTTIMLADKDEFVVLHTNDVINYLSIPLDWSIAPSSAAYAKENQSVVKQLFHDEKINPFVFSVDQLDDAIEKIKDLTSNVKRLIPITDRNITVVFNYFLKNIIGKNSLSPNQLANLFVQILINPIDNYLHPVNKISAIVTKSFGPVPVKKRSTYQSFFEHFNSEYNPKEKELLTSIIDRLVDEVIRRKEGAFFTQTIWADKAHEYISSVFGDDWKDKYVVWDPAWGTGNLTRDYKFKELYCSTLNQSDIDTANQMGYNFEAVKFKFDFLNDPDEKLPNGLINAINEGKEIIILMNPPYGTANDYRNVSSNTTKHKEGIANTNTIDYMKQDGFGESTRNLYSQFLYKVYRYNKINKNIKIAVFCPPNFISSTSFKNFRKKFFNEFSFEKGFLLQSSNFSDVSDTWGISFCLINPKKNENKFVFDVIETNENFELEIKNKKEIYNLDDGHESSEWIRKTNKNKKVFETIQLKSALNPGQNNLNRMVENSMGYLFIKSNKVQSNSQEVGLYSVPTSSRGGVSLDLENFINGLCLFAARKTIQCNWQNITDEYLVPNQQHGQYSQFTYDSIVYSLFNNSSQQSSLRQVTYKDKFWDIKNEFFWLSKNEMIELSNQNNYSGLYNDARTDSDRYVYKLLFGEERIYDKLSPDAKLVLDKATELVTKSMQMREMFATDENHLKSWDAGYAQLKLLWKEHYADDFKEFRQLYKNLEDRMRPLVYELGFLMK